MSKYSNFREYLHDVYGQEISELLVEYANEYPDRVGLGAYYDIKDLEIIDLHVTGATFKALGGDRLEIRTTVRADVEFSGCYRGEYDVFPDEIKANVIINATLHDGLKDFEIVRVKEYDDFIFNKDKSLSQNLVPYLYEEDVEKAAEDFLKRNYPEALNASMALPVEDLAKRMELTVYDGPLTPNTFGRMYFDESEAEIYKNDPDDALAPPVKIRVKPGTMIVNQDMSFLRGIGARNNTIVHECVHWDRHRLPFELWKLLNGGISHISCEQIAEDYQGLKADADAIKWMEWQANQLAPRILMPKSAVLREMNRLWESAHFKNPDAGLADVFELMVEGLAEFFDVSKLAAKIRLLDLGYDQAEGACVYVNGESVPAYTFPKGTLQKGQTFLIDEWNAMRAIMINQSLRDLYFAGKIVYVDGVVCVNDPKYVEYDDSNRLRLTELARDNVSECCFVFSRDISASREYKDTYYRMCFLCRDVSEIEYLDVKFDLSINTNLIENAKRIAKELSALDMKIKEIEDLGFNETLDYHMMGKKITNQDLSFRCGTSTQTVSGWRTNEDDLSVSIGLALCLCNALELHPAYSRDLIRKSNYDLNSNAERNIVINMLIERHIGKPMEEWEAMLKTAHTGIVLRSWKNKKHGKKQ